MQLNLLHSSSRIAAAPVLACVTRMNNRMPKKMLNCRPNGLGRPSRRLLN